MKKSLFMLLLTLPLVAAELRIAVAANMGYAITPLKLAFEKHYTDVNIEIILGSSGKLSAQILHSAPYDIFLSADMHYPQALFKKGFTTTPAKVYAIGSLALLSTKGLELHNGLAVLTKQRIKHIAMANPKTAPYGKATLEALQNSNLLKKTKRKLIYGESIAQTLTYATGAADIGFVATSALYNPKLSHLREHKEWVKIDTKLYTPIKQGMVLLTQAKDKQVASTFYKFMQSSEAKKILQTYGYTTP